MTTRFRVSGSHVVGAACILGLAISAGCEFQQKTTSPTSQTATTLQRFIGNWTSSPSSSTGLPSPDSCTDLKWNPTVISGNSASGSFSATCAGNVTLSGTGSGTLEGTKLTWNATGQATAPGPVTCSFTLSGTAEPEGTNAIKVIFEGSTCMGAVSGIEILTKK